MMSGYVQASRQMSQIPQSLRTRTGHPPHDQSSLSTLQQGQNFASTSPFDSVRSFPGVSHRQAASSSAGQSAVCNPQARIATDEEVHALQGHWIVVTDKDTNLATSMQVSTNLPESAANDQLQVNNSDLERHTSPTRLEYCHATDPSPRLAMSPSCAESQAGGTSSWPAQGDHGKDLLADDDSFNCEGIAQSPIQLPALAHILQAAQEMRNMQDDAELRNKDVSSIVTDLESVLVASSMQQVASPTSSSSACNSSRHCLTRSLDQCVTSRSNSPTGQPSSGHGPSDHRRRDSFGSDATLAAVRGPGVTAQADHERMTCGDLDASGVHNVSRGPANSADVDFGARLPGEHTKGTMRDMNEDEKDDYSPRDLEHKVTGIRSLLRTTNQFSASISSEGFDDKFESPRDLNFQSIFNESPLPSLHSFEYPPPTPGFGSAADLHPTQVFSDALSCGDYQAMSDTNSRQETLPFAPPWEEDCNQQAAAGAPLPAAYTSNPWQAADPNQLAVFNSGYSIAGIGATTSFPAAAAAADPIRSMSSCKAEEVSPGVHLVNQVISCADAIGSSNFGGANVILSELSTMVSPYGDAMQRVASYFTYGLVARMAGIGCGPGLYRALGCKEPTPEGVLSAFQCFHEICPFTKFAGMTANQALLEAFQGQVDVHVIDFAIIKAWPWMSLLQDLKSRAGGPPSRIRLTAVALAHLNCSLWSPEAVQDAGQQISSYAHTLGLQFEFRMVVEMAGSLQPWQLVDPGDCASTLAVSCTGVLHKLLHDDTGHAMANVLAVVHNLKPKVVTVMEPDANHNSSHFLARFLEALHFYSAIFDSLAAALNQDSPERAQIEQLWFGREIINIVACEGRERVERYERLSQWRDRLIKAGFHPKPVSDHSASHIKWLLNQYPGNGFQMAAEHGCLTLRWKERPLFFASAWSP